MQEIKFIWWLLEGRPWQGKKWLPDWLDWLFYLADGSKSHHEISISYIFLQSPHQVEMKNIVKCYKDFLGYSNILDADTHRAIHNFPFGKKPFRRYHENKIVWSSWTWTAFNVVGRIKSEESLVKTRPNYLVLAVWQTRLRKSCLVYTMKKTTLFLRKRPICRVFWQI